LQGARLEGPLDSGWPEDTNRWRRREAEVIGPADAEYDPSRRCFNASIAGPRRSCDASSPQTPRPRSTSPAAYELEVAVRGGGHNPAGHCVCDDRLVIDLAEVVELASRREEAASDVEEALALYERKGNIVWPSGRAAGSRVSMGFEWSGTLWTRS